jgi:microcystin-dependent protein
VQVSQIENARKGGIMMYRSSFRIPGVVLAFITGFTWSFANLCVPQSANADAYEPFLGEISCGGWTYCPESWMECDGSLLSISQNNALYTLIGTTYGGNGTTNFAIPNIRGRTMIHQGQGSGLSNRTIGETGGAETVTLTTAQIPAHNHNVAAYPGAQSASPVNRHPGTTSAAAPVYTSSAPDTSFAAGAITSTGESQPHNNLQPYLAVKCCIAVNGIYPPRD